MADDSPSSIRAIRYGYIMAHGARAKVALLGVVDEALSAGYVDAGLFPREALALLKKKYGGIPA